MTRTDAIIKANTKAEKERTENILIELIEYYKECNEEEKKGIAAAIELIELNF